jgi:hypothetical protein
MDGLRRFTEMNNRVKIRMNFPGGGSQGLDVDEVAPLLLPLPQTVTVCHQGEIQPVMPASFPGFKAIYVEVERMLQEGRYNQAVEFLVKNGFDIQSAMNQVNAVQRILSERAEKDAERVKGWRQSQFSFYEEANHRRRAAPRPQR